MRTDGKRNNHAVIDHKQSTITIGNIKIENRMAVPKNAFEFVHIQGGMPPVISK